MIAAAGGQRVLLSLGSNVDPDANMRRAVARLLERFPGARVSPLYLTRAVGFDGADFLNAAMVVRSDLAPGPLHAWLTALEDAAGRRRDVPRFSDRPIDVDIAAFDDVVRAAAPELPRPELVEQAFTLRPCADVAPDYLHPLLGRTLAELAAADPAAAAMRPAMGGRWWEAAR